MDSEYLSRAKQTAEKVIYVLLFLLLLYSGPSVKLNFASGRKAGMGISIWNSGTVQCGDEKSIL
jgi:hypothetical protein